MKVALSLITVFLILICATAQTFNSQYAAATVVYTASNSVAITLTNQVSQFFTNNIEFGLYHTFHVSVTGSDTNTAAKVGIDRSLDGISWIVVGTNANAALSTTGFGEQTMIGKWSWARYRVYGSNVTGNIYYLGGR